MKNKKLLIIMSICIAILTATAIHKTLENDNKSDETEIEKKIKKESWLDSWFPNIGQKPFEMVGAYTTVKFLI